MKSWSTQAASTQNRPLRTGLAYYISPPSTFANIIDDPLHAFCYILFVPEALVSSKGLQNVGFGV